MILRNLAKIDFAHCDYSANLWARKIWQILFDIYRHNGGSLNHMDSLLCDLRILAKHITKVRQLDGQIPTLYWSFGSNGYTSLTTYEDDPPHCTIFMYHRYKGGRYTWEAHIMIDDDLNKGPYDLNSTVEPYV